MAMLCDGCGDDISRLSRPECHIPLAKGAASTSVRTAGRRWARTPSTGASDE